MFARLLKRPLQRKNAVFWGGGVDVNGAGTAMVSDGAFDVDADRASALRVLKKYLGSPDYEYEPWWYGSPWTKRTALWGRFNIPERKYWEWEDVPKIPELYTRPGRGKPSLAFMHKNHARFIPEFSAFKPDSDMEFRSLCSQKFALAFYEANP